MWLDPFYMPTSSIFFFFLFLDEETGRPLSSPLGSFAASRGMNLLNSLFFLF